MKTTQFLARLRHDAVLAISGTIQEMALFSSPTAIRRCIAAAVAALRCGCDTHANITMPAQWRIHLSPFTKDDRGRGSQWQQTYFWRAFAHTLSVCVRMQLLRAGGCWLQPALRRHRGYILDKTVLYTGSVFEYIRARRFQTLAQGQSRMTMIAQGDATMHELGDDCTLPASPGLLLANNFSPVLPRHRCNTA